MQNQSRNTVLVVVLLLISLPYLLAALAGGSEAVFTGILMNPWDGATYLAKMRMGFDGAWRFTLPYTAEIGNGTYLYLFYLVSGHAARLLNLPLAVVYHLARVAGAMLLVLSLDRFLRLCLPGRPDLQRAGLWLTSLGAGMGWLVIFFGPTPSDFWVAEAYPFLSMYTNPHFPLGLALLLGSFSDLIEWKKDLDGGINRSRWTRVKHHAMLAISGLLLSVIMPFGVVVQLVVAGVWLVWESAASMPAAGSPPAAGRWQSRWLGAMMELISLGCLGGPFLLYQYWAMMNDALLRGWNAQNITPTPPAWDILLSFSPAMILAVGVMWALRKREKNAAQRMAIAWFVLALVLAAVPFSLQRRFLVGYYIPVTALAVTGMDALSTRFPAHRKRLWRWLFGLALPSTVLILVIGLFGILGRESVFYLAADEARALEWISSSTPEQSIVVASPDMGRWIPSFSGRRVIYGHPFETVNANQEEAWVTAVYAAPAGPDLSALQARGVDFLYYGPRERKINPSFDRSALKLVFASTLVQVYAVEATP